MSLECVSNVCLTSKQWYEYDDRLCSVPTLHSKMACHLRQRCSIDLFIVPVGMTIMI